MRGRVSLQSHHRTDGETRHERHWIHSKSLLTQTLLDSISCVLNGLESVTPSKGEKHVERLRMRGSFAVCYKAFGAELHHLVHISGAARVQDCYEGEDQDYFVHLEVRDCNSSLPMRALDQDLTAKTTHHRSPGQASISSLNAIKLGAIN